MDGVPSLLACEFAVTPWDEIDHDGPDRARRSHLEPDSIIGFQITILDSDAPGQYSGSYSVFARIPDWDLADSFVDGLLIPCHVGDCSRVSGGRTATSADSWGRIKAALR